MGSPFEIRYYRAPVPPAWNKIILPVFPLYYMRPHVTVNFAMSADGKLATRERTQVKISGKEDFGRVDELKSRSDAVMVGIGTVLADDPSLTIKSEELKRQRVEKGLDENPTRIVVDSRGRTPPGAAILNRGPGRRIIGCSNLADREALRKLEPLAQVIITGQEEVDLPDFLEKLYGAGISSLVVEGGGTLLWSLFREGLVDEVYQYVGSMIIGGKDAPTPADGRGFGIGDPFVRLHLVESQALDDGILLHWRVKPVS